MLSVLHIITDLDGGGAETVLARLISADSGNTHHVVSLMDAGTVGPTLTSIGVSVHTLHLPHGMLTLNAVVRLGRLVREINPDVVQTWMYHADFLGGLVVRMTTARPVLWGLHNGNLDAAATRLRTRIVVRACSVLSHFLPARIISCSHVGAQLHIARGYSRRKIQVIANGYDHACLAPDAGARRRLRAEWNIPDKTLLLGMVARWDPQKDHTNLFAALAELQTRLTRPWHCVLVGCGMSRENHAAMRLAHEAGVSSHITLCGPRSDIPAVMSALDVHVLSSRGEAFPNVVAEAMACGTPCVVTNVGDAPLIVGETGWVTPPRDARALADALLAAAAAQANAEEWGQRQAAVRERIVNGFAMKRMVEAYQQAWQQATKSRVLRPVPQPHA